MSAGSKKRSTPSLEGVAASLGLLLTLGTFGFIGWEAAQDSEEPPVLQVRPARVTRIATGYVLEVEVYNRAGETAASVEIEGTLKRTGRAPTTSRLLLDYVPGRSVRRGGLLFDQDPRSGELELRAVGYAEP